MQTRVRQRPHVAVKAEHASEGEPCPRWCVCLKMGVSCVMCGVQSKPSSYPRPDAARSAEASRAFYEEENNNKIAELSSQVSMLREVSPVLLFQGCVPLALH